MGGDFSRLTFDPRHNYNRVAMQQGRVQLDADWNEQVDLLLHLVGAQLLDIIGASGCRQDSTDFLVVPSVNQTDLVIQPGRIYVNGMLCSLFPGSPVAIVPPLTPPSTTITVAEFAPDGRAFAPKQWVAVLDAVGTPILNAGQPVLLQISSIDAIKKQLAFASPVPDKAGQLERIPTYTAQPYFLAPPMPVAGKYMAYLDVWQRTVNAIEAPELADVALGGLDTTTRTQNVWQVKLQPLNAAQAANCSAAFQAVQDANAPASGMTQGRMTAQRTMASAVQLPNQLYRVEVHYGQKTPRPPTPVTGNANQLSVTTATDWIPGETLWLDGGITPTLVEILAVSQDRKSVTIDRTVQGSGVAHPEITAKWARDNASMETYLLQVDKQAIRISLFTKRVELQFDDVKFVELTNPTWILANRPGLVLTVKSVTGDWLEIDTTADLTTLGIDPDREEWFVRRWESAPFPIDPVHLPNDTRINIDQGIVISFTAGDTIYYETGNYWHITARTKSGTIDWPGGPDGPLPALPAGVQHSYAPLTMLSYDGAKWSMLDINHNQGDCRPTFGNLVSGLLTLNGYETLRGALTIDQQPVAPNILQTFDLSTTRSVEINRAAKWADPKTTSLPPGAQIVGQQSILGADSKGASDPDSQNVHVDTYAYFNEADTTDVQVPYVLLTNASAKPGLGDLGQPWIGFNGPGSDPYKARLRYQRTSGTPKKYTLTFETIDNKKETFDVVINGNLTVTGIINNPKSMAVEAPETPPDAQALNQRLAALEIEIGQLKQQIKKLPG